MRHRFHAPAFAVALCTLSAATAQADPVDLLAAAEPKKLDPLVVTGNPLRDKDFVAPVSVLKDEEMLLRRAGSLGDTLAGLAGVSSTFFGPNSGRPIIRGLDGDRVRILSNFGASFDASSLSFDHSPAIDPLAVERVEVLRGPAALLYGGTAIGGVVNIIDRRVAREPLSGSGAIVEARSGGAERENGLSAALDAGNGLFAIHADGATRETADYAVPSAAGRGKRIVNSAGDSKGGAIGISAAADWGYAGISRSEHRSQYGTVAEPDVRIDMRQSRTAFESEWRPAAGAAFESFSLRAGHTVYRHTEFEGSTAGTIFDSSGSDLRIEARHRAVGPLAGVVGVQGDRSRFSALGEEAFVPATESRNRAVFLFEELTTGAIKWSLGLRQEQNRVASSGDTGGGNGRFGVARERRFNPTSASLGATLHLDPVAHLFASVARSKRSPAFYELFADGPHVATAAYEVGDPALRPETSLAFDAGVQWKFDKTGRDSLKVGVYANRFGEFITLRRSGLTRDSEGNGAAGSVTDCGDGTSRESACSATILPEFRYQGVRARLAGFEIEATWRALDGPHALDLELKSDLTRADDRSHGEPLPRIAPLRLRGAAAWTHGPWAARVEFDHAARQSRVPASDTVGATPAFTLWNAALTYRAGWGGNNALLFVKATNIGDRLAYNASSIDTIRALAPLPGRALKAGVQLTF